MPITIVLTGGGSGGHIAPLLSLAHAVKKTNPDSRIAYIGFRGETVGGLASEYKVFDRSFAVSAGKFRRYHGESWLSRLLDIKTWLLNIRDFFRVIIGILSAYRLLGQIKPDVVFSKGGFVAVPVGVAAKLRGITIITHDSDSTAGLANKMIGRWAVVNAVGSKKGDYPYPNEKLHFTGIPLDARIKPVDASLQKKYKNELGIDAGNKVLLVAGGGLGARDLNLAMASIASRILKDRPNWQVLHLSGASQEADTKKAYSSSAPGVANVQVIGFSDKFYACVGAADLIVSRAGATVIAEFALSRKACILVPAPHLAGGHQLDNAKKLKDEQAVLSVGLSGGVDELERAIEALMDDSAKRSKLAQNLHQQAVPDAASKLAEIITAQAKLKLAAGR